MTFSGFHRAAAALLATAVLALTATIPTRRSDDIPFEKHQIDIGANETCAFVDINGDGRLDIVSGENWFEAPSWTRHHFRDLNFFNNYIDAFSELPLDVDGDGAIDIVSATWGKKTLSWWKNPGAKGAASNGAWKETIIEGAAPIEFAFLVDLNNDGKAQEVLPQFGSDKQPLAWYELKNRAFEKHVVSDRSYGHGIGAGDINKDGRNDIVTPRGWLEAPASPTAAGNWTFHSTWEFPTQISFMHVVDVNGDGRNDVLFGYAHNYGLFWMEQQDGGKWKQNLIDDSWSQPHAISMVDWNRDGRIAFLTGKRYMAHNGKDPGEREPLGIYWYELVQPQPNGKPEWARHTIEYATRTGTGMQIAIADYDKDGDLDFAVAGKSGAFLFENKTKSAGAKPRR